MCSSGWGRKGANTSRTPGHRAQALGQQAPQESRASPLGPHQSSHVGKGGFRASQPRQKGGLPSRGSSFQGLARVPWWGASACAQARPGWD